MASDGRVFVEHVEGGTTLIGLVQFDCMVEGTDRQGIHRLGL
jgi:hypothetical protein